MKTNNSYKSNKQTNIKNSYKPTKKIGANSSSSRNKDLYIGDIKLKSNVLLAPMAGVTDVAFRSLCQKFGAGLTTTEMISVNAIFFDKTKKGTLKLLETEKDNKPCSVQLFGNNPERFKEVLGYPEFAKFDIIDINMGCPAKKITRNKEGGELMKEFREWQIKNKQVDETLNDFDSGENNFDEEFENETIIPEPKKTYLNKHQYQTAKKNALNTNEVSKTKFSKLSIAEQLIRTCVEHSNGRPVTVKFRLGYNIDEFLAVDFAKMCEGAGAAAIAVHGRTVAQGYSGKSDYEKIALVKKAVSIPVFANGDIDETNIEEVKRITKCDGFLIGRRAIGHPWIFEEMLTGIKKELTIKDKLQLIGQQISILKRHNVFNFHEIKRHVAAYLSNEKISTQTKQKLMMSKNEFEFFEILNSLLK
jgi:tRNA-dihydrouridine synthase